MQGSDFKKIVSAIYMYPKQQVFIPSRNSEKFRDDLLRIWEYQGAGLRSSFRFCTGSIESRSTSDISFDVQVVPERNQEKIRLKNKDGIFILRDRNENKNYPQWLVYLVSQTLSDWRSSELKHYLNICDSDLSNNRSAYSNLLDIYMEYEKIKLNSSINFDILINLLSDKFPEQNEAINLKSFILFGGEKEHYSNQVYEDVFYNLCTTKKYSAFNAKLLHIEQRANDLLAIEQNSERISSLLLRIIEASPNPLGEYLIANIADNIDPISAINLADRNETLLQVLLYHKPTLGLENGIWWDKKDDAKRERLNTILSSPKIEQTVIRKIMRLFLDNNEDMLVSEVFKLSEDIAVNVALDWTNDNILNTNNLFQKSWRNQLRTQPEKILKWLSKVKPKELSIRTLSFIVDLLDPSSEVILDHGAKYWVNYCDLGINDNLINDQINISTFLLSVALSSREKEAEVIISKKFLVVYNSARDNKIPYEYWQRISYKLPELQWYQLWDRCERLRISLIDKFLNQRIEPKYFFKATDQKDIFEKILLYARDHPKFRKIIRREINKSTENDRFLSEDQWDLINRLL